MVWKLQFGVAHDYQANFWIKIFVLAKSAEFAGFQLSLGRKPAWAPLSSLSKVIRAGNKFLINGFEPATNEDQDEWRTV